MNGTNLFGGFTMSLLSAMLLLLSACGFALLYNVSAPRHGLPVCAFPALFVSGSVCALYLAALAGVLPAMQVFLVLSGLVCGALALALLWRGRGRLTASVSFIFLFVGILWAFVITRGTNIAHIDDFTHWFRICRVLHYDGAFCTTGELEFIHYVPGTALFITLLTRFIGFSAENCLFAQNVMNISFLCLLFAPLECAKAREKGDAPLHLALVGIASAALCGLNIGVYELMVDAVLAFAPLAAFSLLLAVPETHSTAKTAALVLLLSFAALAKTSGLLFAATTALLCLALRGLPVRKRVLRAALTLAVPAALNAAYGLRANLLYANAAAAPHSLSAARFLAEFRQKSWEDIFGIIRRFLTGALGLTGLAQAVLPMLCFVLLLMLALRLWKKAPDTLRVFVYAVLFWAVYCAGLLGMYLFSMRMESDSELVAFWRYLGTGAAYIIGMTVCLLLMLARGEGRRRFICVLAGLLAVCCALTPCGYILGQEHPAPLHEYTRGMKDAFDANVPSNTAHTSASYLVLWDDEAFTDYGDSFGKARYIACTMLRCDLGNVNCYTPAELSRTKRADPDWFYLVTRYTDYLVLPSDMQERRAEIGELLDAEDLSAGIHPLRKEE